MILARKLKPTFRKLTDKRLGVIWLLYASGPYGFIYLIEIMVIIILWSGIGAQIIFIALVLGLPSSAVRINLVPGAFDSSAPRNPPNIMFTC
jgi:hypothetical protein